MTGEVSAGRQVVRYTPTVPIALIALAFDPILRLGDVTIRWQAVALLAILFVAIALAARNGRRARLRPDDLLFIVVGVVPGAVVGGRLGYVLGHADYYMANPAAIVDPAQGSATLGLAVLGGMLTGAIVARLLGAPIRPWLHAAAVPVLLVIGLGKLAMVLSGTGQGMPADVEWATAFVGPGPWGSLAPEIPAHPAQVYESIVTLVICGLIAAAIAGGSFDARTGRALLVGVALWATARILVGLTWRDAVVVGPLRVEQLLALLVALVCAGLLFVAPARSDGVPGDDRFGARLPEWPDPSTRPRF